MAFRTYAALAGLLVASIPSLAVAETLSETIAQMQANTKAYGNVEYDGYQLDVQVYGRKAANDCRARGAVAEPSRQAAVRSYCLATKWPLYKPFNPMSAR